MPLFIIIVLVALSRLLPHPPNFACIGALALFAGYTMRSPFGLLAPLVALLLSDVIGHVLQVPGMGFYSPMMMLFVYGGFATVVGIGRLTRRSATLDPSNLQHSLLNVGLIAGGSVAGATSFFLISNLGVFIGGAYGHSLAGFMACYVAALPFFLNTLAGDLFFAFVLFGSAVVVGKLDGIRATRNELAGQVKFAD